MNRRTPLYEGKAKIIYPSNEPGTVIQHFKDDATAFNNQKKGTIIGKGIINNRISELLMTSLREIGIPTHFIRRLNMREQLVTQVDIVPVEVVMRNYVAGSFAKRYGLKEGDKLPRPMVEFFLKNDALGDPLVTDDYLYTFRVCDVYEIEELKSMAFRINDFLTGLFAGIGIRLVDFKIEFGRLEMENQMAIILADEISPDTCRLWDLKTGESLDKDRFRKDLGGIESAYQEVARRLGVLPENAVASITEQATEQLESADNIASGL